ncbi:hypothetical protein BDZ97DRAFT_1863816, partial [Flammula alnicola]
MCEPFERLPRCRERVSAPCWGRVLVNMYQQCTEMVSGHKIWCCSSKIPIASINIFRFNA